ncbi:hypothetical protein [Geothrix fuzhouensis]|uniref:hypothetical protein n=1 Tax=Geothrix fuzhouensis TaxID=2966451 RepID=UPI0021497525|nr:hypothetical protein [Geothrix fuzhouensis]
MTTLVCTALLVVLFFGLALYAIRREDRRTADRRQQSVPSLPSDQRQAERRSGSVVAFLRWALGSLAARFKR